MAGRPPGLRAGSVSARNRSPGRPLRPRRGGAALEGKDESGHGSGQAVGTRLLEKPALSRVRFVCARRSDLKQSPVFFF